MSITREALGNVDILINSANVGWSRRATVILVSGLLVVGHHPGCCAVGADTDAADSDS
jgi:hypothetical protein